MLRVSPPLILMTIAFRSNVIHFLYHNRFHLAIRILGFQLAGDMAKGVMWTDFAPSFIAVEFEPT